MTARKLHVPSAGLAPRAVALAAARPLAVARAEATCAALLGEPHAVLFASARGALAAAAACLAGGREVALPAYTCIAVPNAMLTAGAGYAFADVGPHGTVERWPAADVVVVQDTYGFPARVPEGATVIRDCAHSLDLLSSAGVAVAVTSFEHSKWQSAGRGGLAVTADADLAARLRAWRDRHPAPPALRSAATTFALAALGRRLFRGARPRPTAALAMAADLLGRSAAAGQSIDELEGRGVAPELLGPPDRVTARLIVGQLRRRAAVAAHRARVAGIYDAAAGISRSPLPLVRYPMLVDDVAAFEAAFAARGWDAEGRWFDAPLHPGASDPGRFGYRYGSAPMAERLADHVVNLPTHPLVSDADARELIAIALGAGARPLERP